MFYSTTRYCVITFQKKTFATDADDISTYRQLIDRNVPNEWLDLGMDLLIGVPTDKKSGFGSRTFLPDELMQLYDSTKKLMANY